MGKENDERIEAWSRNRLRIANNAIFKRVMRNKEICSGVISRILGIEVEDIGYLDTEHEGLDDVGSPEVRFDCYCVESSGDIYDVEMQISTERDLLNRLRVYQSYIDREAFRKKTSPQGPGLRYREVSKTAIVFICLSNPFPGYERHVIRTISPHCEEDPGLDCDCGAKWVVVDAKMYGECGDVELRTLLELFVTNKAPDGDDLTRLIESEVSRYTCGNEGKMLLDTQTESFNDGYDIGMDKGKAEGEAKGEARGVTKGKVEGKAELSKLIGMLLDEGKIDEAKAAVADSELQDRLMVEYGIVQDPAS